MRTLLAEDPSGYIGRRCLTIAQNMPDSFPSVTVVRNYLNPITTDFDPAYRIPSPLHPDVREIARLLKLDNLYVGMSRILAVLRRLLWRGLALRSLLEHATAYWYQQERTVCLS